MFDDALTQLFNTHQDKMDNRKAFYGIVKDSFPTELMRANLVLMLYDMKIHEELQNTTSIGNAFAFRFVKRLMDEHGVSRKNADWAVSSWCVCYGKNILGKNCEIQLVNYETTSAPAIKEEKQKSSAYTNLFTYGNAENNDEYAVVAFNGENNNTVIFQNRYNGKNVTEIGMAAFAESTIREAIITDGYVKIGKQAFQECSELSQVIMPVSLKEIADYAFDGCSNLSTLLLPANLQQIGKYAFARTGLKHITFPNTLYWIDEGAFSDCDKIVEISIPRTITRVPDKCFANCDNLTKVKLEEGIESIGAEAFRECVNILDITIPDSVTNIGENAFAEMNNKFLIQCGAGSYAEEYARQRKIKYQLV